MPQGPQWPTSTSRARASLLPRRVGAWPAPGTRAVRARGRGAGRYASQHLQLCEPASTAMFSMKRWGIVLCEPASDMATNPNRSSPPPSLHSLQSPTCTSNPPSVRHQPSLCSSSTLPLFLINPHPRHTPNCGTGRQRQVHDIGPPSGRVLPDQARMSMPAWLR